MIIKLFFTPTQDPTSLPEHPVVAQVTQRLLSRGPPSLTECDRDSEQITWTTVRAEEQPDHYVMYDRKVARLVKRLFEDGVILGYNILHDEYAETFGPVVAASAGACGAEEIAIGSLLLASGEDDDNDSKVVEVDERMGRSGSDN